MAHCWYGEKLMVLILSIICVLCFPTLAECDDAEVYYVWPVVGDSIVQPIAVTGSAELSELELRSCVSNEGRVLAAVKEMISPTLRDSYRIDDMDVSAQRIVMLCSDDEGNSVLRVAEWDEANCTYRKTDTGNLPRDSFIDGYHDGGLVHLCIPLVEILQSATSEEYYAEWLFLTFQNSDGEWLLTSFTDGQSFTADLSGDEYVFNDYYQPSDQYEWRVKSIVYLASFDLYSLLQVIRLYAVLM